MVKLWGREYTRSALLERIGRLDQIGGVEAVVLDEGPERGVHALRFSSASGLTCTVLPDRGMDISDMTWHGCSLCWHGASGRTAPSLYQPDDSAFLRSFFAGMLTTCGLTTFGPGGSSDGEQLHLHGLASSLPASELAWGTSWEGDRCTLYAQGMTRQTKLFGENLTLRRHLSMDLAGDTLLIEDVVTNEGWQPSPHMILYHVNAGFPLLDDGARLLGRFAAVTPRDEEATRGLDRFDRFEGPQPNFKEQVFILTPEPDSAGWGEATVWNQALDGGLGLRLRWDTKTLPWMVEWRMLGQGAYVLGVEPVNCVTPLGQAAARAAGVLPVLSSGEEVRYRLELSVVTDSGMSGTQL